MMTIDLIRAVFGNNEICSVIFKFAPRCDDCNVCHHSFCTLCEDVLVCPSKCPTCDREICSRCSGECSDCSMQICNHSDCNVKCGSCNELLCRNEECGFICQLCQRKCCTEECQNGEFCVSCMPPHWITNDD
jgi:hypothetical protein